MKKTLQLTSFLFVILYLNSYAPSFSQQAVERPPQFVLLAFDGSKSLGFWDESLSLSRSFEKASNSQLKFTYFISGVYFLKSKYKSLYNAPQKGPGASAIGFSENDDETLLKRIEYLNTAFNEGHEIASHANGHFDGSSWSESNWKSEFEQFTDLIFKVFSNNKLIPAPHQQNDLAFNDRNITGFRAPQLGVSAGLWPTLEGFSFQYDTSKTSQSNYWPKKEYGSIWNFPLASLKIAGTGKRTLSMDYNFYVAHSGGKPDPANAKRYEQETLDTYLEYFESNYNGNRAPLHIGHHFSKWNNGAYALALKRFAEKVCQLPEVKCVTYQELAQFMDGLDSHTLSLYQKGEFEKITQPISLARELNYTYDTYAQILPQNLFRNHSDLNTNYEANYNSAPGNLQIFWTMNDEVISIENTVSQTEINQILNNRNITNGEIALHVVDSKGNEIDRSTHLIKNYKISLEKQEDKALIGDLPEAHFDDN